MKIAMFGGTFDPVHNGHVALAHRFVETLELDRIYVVPAKTPPHKSGVQTPGEMRLEMCQLAAEPDKYIECSDFELTREGASYTFYTVQHLLELHPECERVYLLTGADMFLTLETWHRFDELKNLVTFCAVPRDNVSAAQLELFAQHLEEIGCRTLVLEAKPVDISSTVVRRRAAEGMSLDGLVPPEVELYIREHGLYGTGTAK